MLHMDFLLKTQKEKEKKYLAHIMGRFICILQSWYISDKINEFMRNSSEIVLNVSWISDIYKNLSEIYQDKKFRWLDPMF